jgi:hypothetical protein
MVGICVLCEFDVNAWEAYFRDEEKDIIVHEDCWWNQKVDHNAQVEINIPPGELHYEGEQSFNDVRNYLRIGRDLTPLKREPICPKARHVSRAVRADFIDNS